MVNQRSLIYTEVLKFMHHATRAAQQYQKTAKETASSPNLILTITTPRDPMPTTVRDLILILQIFFPGELSIHKAFMSWASSFLIPTRLRTLFSLVFECAR
jgi:hypothetical protein